MSNCDFLDDKKQTVSILAKDLTEKINNGDKTLTEEQLKYIRTNFAFKRDFGNAKEGYNNKYTGEYQSMESRVDENGEPKLFYNETSKKYYFLDKNNQQLVFPPRDRGLKTIFSNSDLKGIVSSLANTYLKASGINFYNIDFENGEKVPGLKNVLELQIQNQIEVNNDKPGLSVVEKGLLNIAPNNLLKNIDQLTEEVDKFFKRMSIVISEEEEFSLEEVEENTKDPLFNSNSAERSSKDSISTNIKLRLSLLEDVSNRDIVFDNPTFISFGKVHNTLLKVLGKEIDLPGEDIWPIFKATIKAVSNRKPFLLELYRQIDSSDFTEELQNEFVQAFRLAKIDHRQTDIKSVKQRALNEEMMPYLDPKTGQVKLENVVDEFKNVKVIHSDISVSDSGAKTGDIKINWFKNYASKFLNENNKPNTNSRASFQKIRNGFLDVKKEFEKIAKGIKEHSELDDIINRTIKGFHSIGIDLTADAMAAYLDDYSKEISLDYKVNKLREILTAAVSATKNIEDSLVKTGDEQTVNSLFKSSLKLLDLANAEAWYIADGSDYSVRQAGKQLFVYSYESYLSIKIDGWKKSIDEMLKKAKTDGYWTKDKKNADHTVLEQLLNASEYNKGSFNMKYLTGMIDMDGNPMKYPGNTIKEKEIARLTEYKKRMDSFNLSLFNQSSFENDYKATSELSILDYTINDVNKVLKNSFSRTLAPADKRKDQQISTGVKVDAVDFAGEKALISELAIKMNVNYFSSEYNRMITALNQVVNSETNKEDGKDLTIHYHYKSGKFTKENMLSANGNAFKSQYFERLSPKTKNLTDLETKIHNALYDENGYPKLVYLSEDSNAVLLSDIKTYITIQLMDKVNKTVDSFISLGIIDVNKDGNYSLSKVDNNLIKEYKDKYNSISKEAYVYAFVTDYYVNALQRNIEYSKMFTGDIAYYKNPTDFKKRIPATYIDGLRLRLKKGDESFRIATVTSINRPSPFLDKLKAIYKDKDGNDFTLGKVADNYENINSADGQAWITPQRWKFLQEKLGKWKNKTHAELYRKMISDIPEVYTEKELKLAAQPLKGVYFGRDVSGKPIFLKYSQAVLTKQLVSGTELEALYDKMIEKSIDETLTLDAIKVGSLTPRTIDDGDGNFLENFDLNSMVLNNADWKLQQDLPTKSYKYTDVGSQIQKNIFAGLNFRLNDDGFLLDGNYVTGKNVMDEIVKTVTGLTNNGLIKLKKDYGIDENYRLYGVKKLYSKLIDDLEKRGSSENLVNALKAELLIPGIPQAGSKLVNMFMSAMNDRLIKIKTNGGSFIQMSNFGINKTTGNKAGVKWAPYADSTTNEPYPYVGEDGRIKIKPGGVLIPAGFIAKHIPNWSELSSEEIFGTYEGDKLIEKGLISPEILDNIIGYRIPNQGLASNDALRIVGILPEDQGDTIVAYTGITTKTGSDFDIDKMYIMFPSIQPVRDIKKKLIKYVHKNLEGKNKEQTIENIVDVLDQINPEYDKEEFDSSEFADSLMSIKSVDDLDDLQNSLLKDAISQFVSVIMRTKKDSPLAEYIREEANTRTVKELKAVNSKGNSNAAQANRLIELYKSVLTHPEVYKKTMEPIDIPIFKDEINALNEEADNLVENNPFGPLEDISLRYDFLKGVAGIGMEANALVDTNRPGEISLFDFYVGWGNVNESGDTKFDEEFSQPLDKDDLDYYVEEMSKYKKRKGEVFDEEVFREDIQKVSIGDSLTAIINAFVDIAADPYITKGNWNIKTTNIGNLLLRSGMHPIMVTNYLAQPILKDYLNFLDNSESLTISSREESIERFKTDSVLSALKEKDPLLAILYKKHFKKLDTGMKYNKLKKDLAEGNITQDQFKKSTEAWGISRDTNEKVAALDIYKGKGLTIKEAITKVREDMVILKEEHKKMFSKEKVDLNVSLKYLREQITKSRDNAFQLNILNHFKTLSAPSSALRDNVTVSKLDTSGGGKNVNSLFGVLNLKNSILSDEANNKQGSIRGFDSKFDNTTLEVYNESLNEMVKIIQSNPTIFPQGAVDVQAMFNKISQQIYGQPASNKELMDDLEISFNTFTLTKFFDLSIDKQVDLLVRFPKRLNEFMLLNKDKYFILEDLKVILNKSKNGYDEIIMSNRKKDPEYENELTESWEDLRKDHPEIGNSLIEYAFLTSGYKMHKHQFFTYTPYTYFVDKDINRFMNKYIDTYKDEFQDLFFRNNYDKNSYIKNVPLDFKKYPATAISKGIPLSVGYSVSTENFKPNFVKRAGKTYKLMGFDEDFNAIYIATEKASITYNSREMYNYSQLATAERKKYNTDTLKHIQTIKDQIVIDAYDYNEINEVETVDSTIDPDYKNKEAEKEVEEIEKEVKKTEAKKELVEDLKDALDEQGEELSELMKEFGITDVSQTENLTQDQMDRLLEAICKF